METVVACDAGRFGLKTWLRRRWALPGERPPWVVQDSYHWVWLYVAVEPLRGQITCLLLPAVDHACFQAFLLTLRTEVPEEQVGIVLDNAPSHRSHQVVWPDGFVPLPLPPYSPELNPIERVWRDLKDQCAWQHFPDLEAQQDYVADILCTYDPAALQSLTGYRYFVEAVNALTV